jgi:hypothetical protein
MTEFIMQYWLAFLFGGITYLFRHYLKKLDTKLDTFTKEQVAMKVGIQAVLRDRIIQSHKYLGDRGYATIEDRDNIFNMYEQYHQLGANGVIDGLMDDICELPVRKPKDGGKSDS